MKHLLLLILLIVTNASVAKVVPVETFTKQSLFNSLKLSPDGKHIAATVPKGNTTKLVIINKASMTPIKAFSFSEFEHIGSFYWAGNKRVVYSKVYQKSDKEKKTNLGELFSVNIDGSKRQQIFGYSNTTSKNASKKGLRASAKIIHMLPDDPKHLLIVSRKWGNDIDDPVKVFKINIFNGKRTLVSKTPLGNMKIVFDVNGNPVIASGKNRKGKRIKYLFSNNQWQEIDKNNPIIDYAPLRVNFNRTKLYLSKNLNIGGTSALYQYDFASKNIELLFNNPNLDIKSYIVEPGSKNIIGVKTMFDGISYHYLDENQKFTALHKALASAFPGQDINITANSVDAAQYVITVKSDKNPGDYYLYDQNKNSLNFLISKKPWIDETQMLHRELVQFEARDGKTIYGYLTKPESIETPLPLIIDVHGGPYGVQDSWYFNSDAQFFANNGYAVLQINFRGSGGYGDAYEKDAYLKRSTLIQHDIIDGTRWAQSLASIDDNKVCIIGGSFGGYSALMSPLLEPELYKCSVSRYGPYDLVYQMKNADYMSKDSVSVGAMKKYGKDEEFWTKESPLTYIDKLKTPIFIVTGGKDTRVPPQSAWNLRAALDDRNIAYDWLYKEKEGHGFINPKNKIELYQKSLAFIDKHINR